MSMPSARRSIGAPSEHYPKVVAHLNDPRRSPDCLLGLIASHPRVHSAFQSYRSVGHGNVSGLAIELRASFQSVLDKLFDVFRLRLTFDRNVVDNAYDTA